MLARLIMFATGESVANILNFVKKYMQVDSLWGYKIANFSLDQRVCHFAFFLDYWTATNFGKSPIGLSRI